MMRSRINPQPCIACGVQTRFEREVVGKRGGHLRWDPACLPCGESGAPAMPAEKYAEIIAGKTRKKAA